MLALRSKAFMRSSPAAARRWASTAADKDKFKVVVVGAGAQRLTHQSAPCHHVLIVARRTPPCIC